MAERALLAHKRPDGWYAVATARWGGTDRALAAVCAGTTPASLPDIDWIERDHQPDFRAVLASLDVLATELCYRVDDGVTVFLPLWFGLPLAPLRAHPGMGALVAIDSLADARACRRWFRSLKGALADAVTAGTVPWPAVPLVLLASLETLAPRERYLLGAAERL